MSKGRVILVTGANRGIGLATVQGLSQQLEDTVLLGCRNMADGQAEADKLGENVIAVSLDLAERKNLEQQIEAILAEYGKVDVLINNAGLLCPGNLFEGELSGVDDSLRVNTLGPIELIKKLAPLMMKNGYGRIVNLSSGWGSFAEGLTGPFAYSLTKAALNAVTMTVALNLSGDVLINSMCPGWVRTRMGGESAPREPEKGAETAIWLANLEKGGPNGKFFRDKEEISW